jgi:hypothetical protein
MGIKIGDKIRWKLLVRANFLRVAYWCVLARPLST